MKTREAGRGKREAIVLALIAIAAAIGPRAARAQDMGISVGARAPVARVQTLDGKPANLSQVIGKAPALIEFWATWCPNCKELEPTLKRVAAKYAGKIRFVGVSVSVDQSLQRVRLYVQKYGMPGEQYFDASGDATGAYDVPATSYVVIVDRTGKVVYTGLGGDQDLDAAIRKAL